MRHAYGLGEHYNSVEPLKDLANEEEGWPSHWRTLIYASVHSYPVEMDLLEFDSILLG